MYIRRPRDVKAHEYKAPDAYRKAARDLSSPLANAIHLASSLSRALHRSPVPQPYHRRASSPRARERDAFARRRRLARARPRTKTSHTTPRASPSPNHRESHRNRIVRHHPSRNHDRRPVACECVYAHRTFYHEIIVITSISHAHDDIDDDIDDDINDHHDDDDDIRTETQHRRRRRMPPTPTCAHARRPNACNTKKNKIRTRGASTARV